MVEKEVDLFQTRAGMHEVEVVEDEHDLVAEDGESVDESRQHASRDRGPLGGDKARDVVVDATAGPSQYGRDTGPQPNRVVLGGVEGHPGQLSARHQAAP